MSGEVVNGKLKVQAFDYPIEAVTCYADRAQVSRTIKIKKLAAGQVTIQLQGISSSFIAETLQAEGKGNFTLIDLGYEMITESISMKRPVPLDATEEKVNDWKEQVKELDQLISDAQIKQGVLNTQLQVLQTYFKSASNLVLPVKQTENFDLCQAMSDKALDGFDKLMKMYGTKGEELTLKVQTYEREIATYREKQATLRGNINIYTVGLSHPYDHFNKEIHQINIAIEVMAETDIELLVSYGVSNCNWTPKYDVRVQASDKQVVSVGYKATVVQRTGEQWKDVTLTLSTAQPAQGGDSPEYHGFWDIKFYQPPPPQPVPYSAYDNVKFAEMAPMAPMAAMAPPPSAPSARRAGASYGSLATTSAPAPAPAPLPQMVEMKAKATQGATSSTFEVPLKCTIDSDNQPHVVTVARLEMKPTFNYYCCPKLADKVYLKAKVVNESDFMILPGGGNVFLDGQFVCKISVPLVMTGEDFSLSLGADASIKVKRTNLIKNSEVAGNMFSSKSNIVHCSLKIEVTNKKKIPVQIKIAEQVPRSNDDKLQVKMIDPVLNFENDKSLPDDKVAKAVKEIKDKPDKDDSIKCGDNQTVEWLVNIKPGDTKKLPLKFDITYAVGSPTLEGI